MIRAYDDYGNVVDLVKWENEIYNKALEDVLQVVEWDGYTLDVKERIEQLKKGKEEYERKKNN